MLCVLCIKNCVAQLLYCGSPHFLPFSRYLNCTCISKQQEVGYFILSRAQTRVTNIFLTLSELLSYLAQSLPQKKLLQYHAVILIWTYFHLIVLYLFLILRGHIRIFKIQVFYFMVNKCYHSCGDSIKSPEGFYC